MYGLFVYFILKSLVNNTFSPWTLEQTNKCTLSLCNFKDFDNYGPLTLKNFKLEL